MPKARVGAPCGTCNHPDRLAIERMMRQRRPLADIEAKYFVSKSALSRHREKHLDQITPQENDAPESVDEFEMWAASNPLSTPEQVLRYCQVLVWRIDRVASRAEDGGDLRTAVAALSAAAKQMESVFAKVTGLISDAPRIDQSTRVVQLFANLTEEDLIALARRAQQPALES